MGIYEVPIAEHFGEPTRVETNCGTGITAPRKTRKEAICRGSRDKDYSRNTARARGQACAFYAQGRMVRASRARGTSIARHGTARMRPSEKRSTRSRSFTSVTTTATKRGG